MNTTSNEFPHVDADLAGDGLAEVTALGMTHTFVDEPDRPAVTQALEHIAALASVSTGVGRDVYVNCHDRGTPTGRLVVSPTGEYFDESNPTHIFVIDGTASDPTPPAPHNGSATVRTAEPAWINGTPPTVETAPAHITEHSRTVPARAPGHRRAEPARARFINTDPVTEPAERGWRGMLTQAGMRIAPSDSELARRDDERLVAGHWPGLRTVAVINPKGSANKTPSCAALSAVFARYGGGGVLAWDNNETRGTLGWRTEQSHTHEATVLDLLPDADRLLSPTAAHGDIAGYVHHQTRDKYDVLRSDQSVVGDHEVTGEEVDIIESVAARYYRLLIIDSGNNERAANWRSMLTHADQIVVPCTNSEDTAEAAARMLEALHRRDERSDTLANSAVVIVSQRTPGRDDAMGRIVEGFAPLVRAVCTIDYDPGLRQGHIAYDNLRRSTQRQWLTAAAAVARGL